MKQTPLSTINVAKLKQFFVVVVVSFWQLGKKASSSIMAAVAVVVGQSNRARARSCCFAAPGALDRECGIESSKVMKVACAIMHTPKRSAKGPEFRAASTDPIRLPMLSPTPNLDKHSRPGTSMGLARVDHNDFVADEEREAFGATKQRTEKKFRRYHFGSQDPSQAQNFAFTHHYDVVVEAETDVHGADDHLVMYYTDYLDAPPAPPIKQVSNTEMDVMELKKWLSTVKPRSRTDAFPLYQLAKGVLSALADNFLQLTEKERDLLLEDKVRLEIQLENLEKKYEELNSEFKSSTFKLKSKLAALQTNLDKETEVKGEGDKSMKLALAQSLEAAQKLAAETKKMSLQKDQAAKEAELVKQRAQKQKDEVQEMRRKMELAQKEMDAKILESIRNMPVDKLYKEVTDTNKEKFLHMMHLQPRFANSSRLNEFSASLTAISTEQLLKILIMKDSRHALDLAMSAVDSDSKTASKPGASSDASLEIKMAQRLFTKIYGTIAPMSEATIDRKMNSILADICSLDGETYTKHVAGMSSEQLNSAIYQLSVPKIDGCSQYEDSDVAVWLSSNKTDDKNLAKQEDPAVSSRMPSNLSLMTMSTDELENQLPAELRGTAKPMSYQQMSKFIAQIYEEKIRIDDNDDAEGRPRQNVVDFLQDVFLRQFGLRSLALKQTVAMRQSMEKFAETTSRARVFCFLCGTRLKDEWSREATDFLLYVLRQVFPKTQIRDRMDLKVTDQQPMVPLELVLVSTASAFASKFGFGIDPSEFLFPVIVKMSVNGLVPLDDWLEVRCPVFFAHV